ncbi:MAG TPA: hypothetical protein VJ837_06075 [Candidatus Paceibacterota bacterium]|nr:hypothetical protein [Candidatus Paceibacterota bacterium]
MEYLINPRPKFGFVEALKAPMESKILATGVSEKQGPFLRWHEADGSPN